MVLQTHHSSGNCSCQICDDITPAEFVPRLMPVPNFLAKSCDAGNRHTGDGSPSRRQQPPTDLRNSERDQQADNEVQVLITSQSRKSFHDSINRLHNQVDATTISRTQAPPIRQHQLPQPGTANRISLPQLPYAPPR